MQLTPPLFRSYSANLQRYIWRNLDTAQRAVLYPHLAPHLRIALRTDPRDAEPHPDTSMPPAATASQIETYLGTTGFTIAPHNRPQANLEDHFDINNDEDENEDSDSETECGECGSYSFRRQGSTYSEVVITANTAAEEATRDTIGEEQFNWDSPWRCTQCDTEPNNLALRRTLTVLAQDAI